MLLLLPAYLFVTLLVFISILICNTDPPSCLDACRMLNYSSAVALARAASEKQDEFLTTNFTISENKKSQVFRILIPIGYQFEADVLRHVYQKQKVPMVTIDDVISAFKRGLSTPPLNTSRMLYMLSLIGINKSHSAPFFANL